MIRFAKDLIYPAATWVYKKVLVESRLSTTVGIEPVYSLWGVAARSISPIVFLPVLMTARRTYIISNIRLIKSYPNPMPVAELSIRLYPP